MPHIIVEYSHNIFDAGIPALLESLHDGLASCDVPKAKIKTRGVEIADFVVGEKGKDGQMAHLTLRILEGRDLPLKKKFGDTLYPILKNHIHRKYPDCAITLEICDMVKHTYYQ